MPATATAPCPGWQDTNMGCWYACCGNCYKENTHRCEKTVQMVGFRETTQWHGIYSAEWSVNYIFLISRTNKSQSKHWHFPLISGLCSYWSPFHFLWHDKNTKASSSFESSRNVIHNKISYTAVWKLPFNYWLVKLFCLTLASSAYKSMPSSEATW